MYLKVYIPNPATQTMFHESIKISFTLTFDSWTTDRRTIITSLDDQLDIASSFDNISSEYLFVGHLIEAILGVPNKTNKIAVFYHLVVRRYFVEINGIRSPRDANDLDCIKDDCLSQYRDLKAFSENA